jgi:hypothetical protein
MQPFSVTHSALHCAVSLGLPVQGPPKSPEGGTELSFVVFWFCRCPPRWVSLPGQLLSGARTPHLPSGPQGFGASLTSSPGFPEPVSCL